MSPKTLPAAKIIHFGHESPRQHEKSKEEIQALTFLEENERFGSFSSTV